MTDTPGPTGYHRQSGVDATKPAAPRDGRWLTLVGVAVLVLWMARATHFGSDALCYVLIDPTHPYASAVGNVDAWPAFRYAPPLALLAMALPLGPLIVVTGIFALNLAAVRVLAGRWWLAALPAVLLELEFGNVDLLIGAAALLGARYPALWAVPLLTKVTPGVGLLWFVVRREWRALIIALGVTGILCLASLVRPELWAEWIAMLASNVGVSPTRALWIPVPLLVRLPLAAILVVWGARRDARWVLPVAAMLALPTLWVAALGMLVGLLRAEERDREPRLGIERGGMAVVDAAGV